MMILQHHEAEEFFRRAKDQFETLYAEGEERPRDGDRGPSLCIASPHRIKYFEKTFAYLKKQKSVLFWTGEEILDWYRAVKKAEG